MNLALNWRRPRVWVPALVAVVGLLMFTVGRAAFSGNVNRLNIDLKHPDLLIRSAHLSQLPKDFATSPLLRDVFSQDLVNYYEDHPTRLSLLGTVQRLAFDHDLTWQQSLLASALDAPAEVAFWRDSRGHPEYFAAVLDHGVLAQAVVQLAKIGLPDSQLTVAGKLPGGASLYALKLNQRQTWLLATVGSRTLVVSDPGMLLNDNASPASEPSAVAAAVLKASHTGDSPFAKDFGLPAFAALKQQVAVKADYLAMGYQYFFPAGQALRADLAAGGAWSTHVRSESKVLADWRSGAKALAGALPRGGALCATLPLDTSRASTLLQSIENDVVKSVTADLQGAAAWCWGSEGGVYSPLLALRLKTAVGARTDAGLAMLFERGTRQPGGTAPKPQAGEMKLSEPKSPAGAKVWTRAVQHEWGTRALDPSASNEGDDDASSGQGHVLGLARLGQTVVASTDVHMIDGPLAVARKTYPSWADETRAVPGTPLISVNGPALAKLVDKELFRVLREADAVTFTRVAHELLPPKLKALSALGSVHLGIPDGAQPNAQGWLELSVLRGKAGS